MRTILGAFVALLSARAPARRLGNFRFFQEGPRHLARGPICKWRPRCDVCNTAQFPLLRENAIA
jgi:hypothetical protein